MADENTEQQNTGDESATGTEPIDWEAKYHAAMQHSRDWENKAKANKSAADELAALKESQLTETEKLTARAEKAEKALAAFKHENELNGWKSAASKETGIPADLLHGDDEESIKASAKALKAFIETQTKPAAPKVPNPSGTPQSSDNPNRALLGALFGNK